MSTSQKYSDRLRRHLCLLIARGHMVGAPVEAFHYIRRLYQLEARHTALSREVTR